jgi:hypothetical protein
MDTNKFLKFCNDYNLGYELSYRYNLYKFIIFIDDRSIQITEDEFNFLIANKRNYDIHCDLYYILGRVHIEEQVKDIGNIFNI